MTTATHAGLDAQTSLLYRKIGFGPTPEQLAILLCQKQFILVSGGEQAGKSVLGAKYLIKRYPDLEEGAAGLYWLVGEDYAQTEREFMYLVEDFAALGLLKKASKRVDPGEILLHDGTRIVTKSGKDPSKLAREAPDGIIMCEAAQCGIDIWERCRGRVTPKNGWLFMSGTFEESIGWYPTLFQAWQGVYHDRQSFSLPAWTNKSLYPGGRNDPKILALERDSTDSFFMERIAGRPVPPKGLVIPEFRPDIHVRDVPWIPGEPVHLWVDPGYAGAHAVECIQIVKEQVRVFDEIYEQGLVTEQMADIVRRREWFKDVKFGVIDVAGLQHQAMAAPAEIWNAPYPKGIGLYMSSQKVRINDGTERLRATLKQSPINGEPGLVVSPKCKGILSELGVAPNPFDNQLRAYRWKTDREGNIVGDTPEDKYNHGIKAVIYGLVDRFGYAAVSNRKVIHVRRPKR